MTSLLLLAAADLSGVEHAALAAHAARMGETADQTRKSMTLWLGDQVGIGIGGKHAGSKTGQQLQLDLS